MINSFRNLVSVSLICILSACGGGGGGGSTSAPALIDQKDFTVTAQTSKVVNTATVNAFKDSAPSIAAALNAKFSLPDRNIAITFRDCGLVNAFYQPNDSSVTICYELLNVISSYVSYLNTSNRSSDNWNILNVVLLHEIGHALIDQYNLPVLGKQEDAADAISATLILENASFITESQAARVRAVLLAGIFLNSLSTNLNYATFADVHSVGPVRLANLTCWALGSGVNNGVTDSQIHLEPSVLSAITPTEIAIIQDKRQCHDEIKQQISDVNTLIGKYNKKP